MFWLTKFFTKGKSLKDAIKYFHTINGRMPNNIETIKIKNAFMEQTRKSNVIKFPEDRITNPFEPRPRKVEPKKESDDVSRWFEAQDPEDPYMALLERQSKEIEDILPNNPGMRFYSAMGDAMKKHDLERLEFRYDEMFNKILDKAKRIEADPKVLLEAELGTKLTGKETTTQLLDFFKKRPKKASGGIARVGFLKGKLAKGFFEFVEGLFIKASNDIRLGRGLFKDLTEKQRIVQHENLTKMVTQWQKTKQLPEGAEQYFGVDAKKAFAAAEAKAKRLGKGKNWKEKEVQAQMSEFEREAQLASEGKPVIPLGGMDERTLIKTKYPGITDDLLNKILIDDNPQRKAEVMATMDEYLKLREVGKSESEAFDIIHKSFSGKKAPTKHATGGIAGQLHLNDGGRVSFTKGGKVSGGLAHVLGV